MHITTIPDIVQHLQSFSDANVSETRHISAVSGTAGWAAAQVLLMDQKENHAWIRPSGLGRVEF
jgi:hypothetical protein